MNKGGNKHYSLLLQEDAESEGLDGIAGEEEEMMIIMAEDDGLCSLVGGETPDTEEETEGDSDEEEIFNSGSRHRTLCNEGSKLNSAISLGRNNEYQLLSNDGQLKSKSLDTPLTTIWTPTPMSPARRACFIASIMFGVLVVSMFLWTLPCDVQPCDGDLTLRPKQWFVDISGIGANHTTLVHRTDGNFNILMSFYKFSNLSSWDYNQSNTTGTDCEESSEVTVSPSDEGTEGVVATRPCNNNINNNNNNNVILLENQCGVLLFDGEAGRERWRLDLQECPVALHCDLLDATGDEISDCLILGYKSMALMVEPTYGSVLWHVHRQERHKGSSHIDNPVAVADFDEDGFKELLFSEVIPSSSAGSEASSRIILVSGKTGLRLGIPFPAQKCHVIDKLFAVNSIVSYSCYTDVPDKGIVENISLSNLVQAIMSNDAAFYNKENISSIISSSNILEKHAETEETEEFCAVKVTNVGKCPSCQGLVSIENKNKVLWNQDYGSHSTITDWKHFAHNGQCYGAILKVWQWHQSTEVYKSIKPHPFINQRTTRSSAKQEDINISTYNNTALKNQTNYDLQHKMVTNNPIITENVSTLTNDSLESTTPAMVFDSQPNYLNNDDDSWDFKDKANLDLKRNARGKKRHMSVTKHTPSPVSNAFYHKLTKKFYEHPTIHHHHGKQTSYVHMNSETEHIPSKVTTQSTYDTGPHTSLPEFTVPPGFKLQKLDENLMIILHNDTNWSDKIISKISVSQLCYKNHCIPSASSHKHTILVEPSRDGVSTNVFITTTTFTLDKKNSQDKNNYMKSPWILRVYVRKIVIFL